MLLPINLPQKMPPLVIMPSNTFADVDNGTTLTYTATLSNGSSLPSWLSFNASNRTFTGTPTNSEVGTIAVKVTASDGSAAVSDTFNITVTNVNDAPTVANAIADQSTAEDASFSYQVPSNTFADVDSGPLTLHRYSNGSSLPSWLSFNASTRTFTGTPTNSEVGTIAVKVTATDGSSASVSDTFNLTVTNTNDAPTISSVAVTSVNEDSTYTYNFAVSDVDVGDTASLGKTVLPNWLRFSSSESDSDDYLDTKATFSNGKYITVSAEQVSGTYYIKAQKYNSNGSTDGSEITIHSSSTSLFIGQSHSLGSSSYTGNGGVQVLSNSGFVVSWLSYDASTGRNAYF